ncbi:MAG: hypothetical protein JXJ22_18595 [Bacteroidales bacterium]|nr:hypothetical protein [Bacteroidales bacterium]
MIKKAGILVVVLILCVDWSSVFSQGAPMGLNYQAVARDYNGQEKRNEQITVWFTIISGDAGGEVQWRENHTTSTNEFGLFNLVIGQGTRESGEAESFSEIHWGLSPHFLKVEIDFDDQYGVMNMGTTQLLSVPYALYAEYAGNGGSGGIGDPDDFDKDPTNERQNLSQTDTLLLLINNDGTTQSSLKNDFDPKNEIQDLSLSNNILKISNNPDANDINLAGYLDNTDKQTLYNKSDSIGITNGNTIDLSRFNDNTDAQRLTMETDSLRISGGNAVDISLLKNPESVYFYANRTTVYVPSTGEYYVLKFDDIKTNVGTAFNGSSGNFVATETGLYSFYLVYHAQKSHKIILSIDNTNVETFETSTLVGTYRYSFMRYLTQGNIVNIIIRNESIDPTEIGLATFAGFKVY